ncbi:MAG: hypothetical protein P1U87_15080 [Verrucomicrobiales bacterium]|nr:hypothetical protein [Verrucomicrobiales bacterium]
MIRRNFTVFPFYPALLALGLFAFVGCGEAEKEGGTGAAQEEVGIAANSGQLTPEQQQEVLNGIMRAKAQEQAEGLGGGRVKVNGAWEYKGYSYLSPDPNAAIEVRLVAVDITVSGHTEFFDIDDIEIVDGASLMSYGSDPHATPLALDGGLLKEGDTILAPPKENRWLLIYGYPKKSPTYRLYYWGRELTPEALEFKESGIELPFPPAEEE